MIMMRSRLDQSVARVSTALMVAALALFLVAPNVDAEQGKRVQKLMPKSFEIKTRGSKGNFSLEFGKTVESELGEGDEALSNDGSLFETWTVNGSEGDVFVVRAASEDITPYIVFFASGTLPMQLAEPSVGFLSIQIPKTGKYMIVVNASEAGENGKYRVRVDRVPPL